MKPPRVPTLLAVFLSLAGGALLAGADTPASAAGYWEGAIATPNRELEIRIELTPSAGAAWQGTIDIPLQGLRGFKLAPVKVDGSAVEFGLPGVPGEPRFAGKLSADAQRITGEFSQGGGSTAFQLERKVKPAPPPRDETPLRGVPGKGLAGNWRGTLSPLPNVELRLLLELTQAAGGKPEGVLVSLDQGGARIPVTSLSEKDGVVAFETASVGGAFAGKLNAEGSELAGDWSQGGRSTPLVLKRMPAAGAGGR